MFKSFYTLIEIICAKKTFLFVHRTIFYRIFAMIILLCIFRAFLPFKKLHNRKNLKEVAQLD